MKSENHIIIKEFLINEITTTAKEKNLTDEQIAELLDISVRAYYYIKSGKNNCSTVTLLQYLIRVCPDVDNFLNRIKTLILQ